MNENLLSALASADPIADVDDAELHGPLLRLSAAAQEATLAQRAAHAPWWRRRRAMIPIGVVAAVALTGAAVFVPLGLGINGIQIDADAEIPIVYTTDNGIDVSCRYGIYFGDVANRSEADDELAEFVQDHDWTGIGQRIYDKAIAEPFVPGPDDDWEVDTQEIRDDFSFERATSLIWDEIPDTLQKPGLSAGATTDCTGQLR